MVISNGKFQFELDKILTLSAVNINDDVTTPLRQDEEETTPSIGGDHFLMEDMNSENKLHDLWKKA